VKKLEAFANENKQTQGKFTIGDEKVSCNRLNMNPGFGTVANIQFRSTTFS